MALGRFMRNTWAGNLLSLRPRNPPKNLDPALCCSSGQNIPLERTNRLVTCRPIRRASGLKDATEPGTGTQKGSRTVLLHVQPEGLKGRPTSNQLLMGEQEVMRCPDNSVCVTW